MRTCPACSLVQDHAFTFCKRCGAELPAAQTAPQPAAATGPRVCPSCHLEQAHEFPFCNQCGTRLAVAESAPPIPVAGPAARVCPACRQEQTHSFAYCKKCGEPLSTGYAPAPPPLPVPRCSACGAPKDPNWHVCEHCGSGAKSAAGRSPLLLWVSLVAFTLLWIAGMLAWWRFTFHADIGPLVAGSSVAIDGKVVTTISQAVELYSTPAISRGWHTFSVTAPDHQPSEFDAHIGWSGMRRRFPVWQSPVIVCVTIQAPGPTAVTAGARMESPNRYCAPAGTKAEASVHLGDGRVVKQAFVYAPDSITLVLEAASAMEQPAAAAPSPAAAPPKIDRLRAAPFARSCSNLLAQREYKAALAACDQALRFDPTDQQTIQLQARVRQTIQALGIR